MGMFAIGQMVVDYGPNPRCIGRSHRVVDDHRQIQALETIGSGAAVARCLAEARGYSASEPHEK
jgi:hypothetical protein